MSISEEDFIKAAENGQLDIVNQAIDQRININCADVSRGVRQEIDDENINGESEIKFYLYIVSRTPLVGGISLSALPTAAPSSSFFHALMFIIIILLPCSPSSPSFDSHCLFLLFVVIFISCFYSSFLFILPIPIWLAD